jgi:hypothetical protein
MTKKFIPNIPTPGSQAWNFKLGDEVRDIFNPSIQGILVKRDFHISGCDTFTIDLLIDVKGEQSALKRTTIESYPGTRLELVQAHPERHKNEIPPNTINLGDKVKDYTTGLVGRVTHLAVTLSYNAPQALVVPEASNGELKGGDWIDFHMLEVLEPYKAPEKKKPLESSASSIGCTPSRIKSSRVSA